MNLIKGGAASNLLRAVLLMALVGARPSFALIPVTNLTNGGSINFSDVITNPLYVQVGDKLFGNFSFSFATTGANQFVPSNLVLSGLSNQIGYGFSLQLTGFAAQVLSSSDIRLYFTAQVTNPFNLISGVDLSINGLATGFGNANVSENVYSQGLGAGSVANLFADLNAGGGSVENFATLSTPQTMVWIEKDIAVNANPGGNVDTNPLGDFAQLSIINQTFAQIPEPSTLFLLAAGVAGLLVLRRRK